MNEVYKTLDLTSYDICLKEKNYLYEISNLGQVRKINKKNNRDITYYKGFFKGKGSHEGNLSIKLKGKVFPLYKLVLEHFSNIEIDKYNISFLDNNKKNCSIYNIKLDLKHKHKNTEKTRELLFKSYENQQLHRILNYKLKASLFIYKSVYQRDDLVHEFYEFVYDRLYDYEHKRYKDFTQFLFLKASDFIFRVRQKSDYKNRMESLEEISSYKKTDDRLGFSTRNGCFFTNS